MNVKISKAVVNDVRVSEQYGQSLTLIDLETGGIARIEMGQNSVDVKPGAMLSADIEVKPAPDKSFGNRLTFQSGTFSKI